MADANELDVSPGKQMQATRLGQRYDCGTYYLYTHSNTLHTMNLKQAISTIYCLKYSRFTQHPVQRTKKRVEVQFAGYTPIMNLISKTIWKESSSFWFEKRKFIFYKCIVTKAVIMICRTFIRTGSVPFWGRFRQAPAVADSFWRRLSCNWWRSGRGCNMRHLYQCFLLQLRHNHFINVFISNNFVQWVINHPNITT